MIGWQHSVKVSVTHHLLVSKQMDIMILRTLIKGHNLTEKLKRSKAAICRGRHYSQNFGH